MGETKILEEIEILKDQIEKSRNEQRYESDQLSELFASLAKSQLEMEIAKTDCANPFFKSKYADLTSVVKASRPFLAKNGLSVIQRILPSTQGVPYLYTRLCHASGQWIESKMAIIPAKNDIQTTGSYITYLRRYCYAAIVGVVSSEEDDDAEQAIQNERKISNNTNLIVSSKISREQLEIISKELDGHSGIVENILKGFAISKLADLESKHFSKCIERIKQIKSQKTNE